MKVKELIEKLKEFDPDTRIVVDGYEGGVDDLLELENIKIKLDVNKAWYYGSHEEIIGEEKFDEFAIRVC